MNKQQTLIRFEFLLVGERMFKIGLVFSGGMAKGAYHIGAIKAVQEFFPDEYIKAVSAASIGSLNAYTFLTGQTDEGCHLWEKIVEPGQKIFIKKMLKSKSLQKTIESISSGRKPVDKDFFIAIHYFDTKELKYVNLKEQDINDHKDFLRASVALPLINEPVILNGHKIFDGATIDNIPVKPLENLDLDFIICFNFEKTEYIFENEQTDSKVIKISFCSDNFVKDSIWFEQNKILEMIEKGHEQTKQILSEYFCTTDKEIILQKIKAANENQNRHLRKITGDFIVSKLNHITQKFIKVNAGKHND